MSFSNFRVAVLAHECTASLGCLLMLQSQEILISLGLLNLRDGQPYLTSTADI